MFYAHAQKQTNKHNSLSLSLSFALSLAALPPPLFGQSHSPASNPDRTTVAYRFSLSSFFKTTQLFFFFFRYCISFFFLPRIFTTLPPSSACLSWDARTLWPPRRGSFERVSSWWWGRFRPLRRSSSGGSRRSSCPCRLAPGAGWPSCRWCGPRGQSSSPSPRRAARRPPGHVRYLEHWEGWHGEIGKVKLKKYAHMIKYMIYHIMTVQMVWSMSLKVN